MPRLYIDLDNNKLLTGASSTQIAATPNLYQGDKPSIELELLTRSSGTLARYASSASALNVRIGSLGSASVASALTLSVLTLSAAATVTCGIALPVTATGISSLSGSIQATATAGANTPSNALIQINTQKAQMPKLIPVLGSNVRQTPLTYSDGWDKCVLDIETQTCGKYFTVTPKIIISDSAEVGSYVATATIGSWRGAAADLQKKYNATATASITNNSLNVSIDYNGAYYYNSDLPDIFVVPDSADYSVGSIVTATSFGTVSTRTYAATLTSHGLSVGDLILIENDKTNTYNYNAAVGIWPITSAGANSFEFKTASYAAGAMPSALYFRRVDLLRTAVSCTVLSSGSGLQPSSEIIFQANSDSCGGAAAVGVTTVGLSGTISLATIVSAGSGFSTTAPTASIFAYKKVTEITVTCAGAGYWDVAPAVNVDTANYVATAPGATQAVVSSSLNGDGTIVLSVMSQGYGYTAAPSLIINAPNQGNGVRSVSLVTAGVGYSSGSFSCAVSAAPTGGINAVIKFIVDGETQSFQIVNPGRGYTSAPAVVVTKPDLDGQVSGFTVTCKGAGYTSSPSVSISGGGGSGASAVAVMDSGYVTEISLINRGSGYTSAPSVTVQSPDVSVYYKKQIDLSSASVTTLLDGKTSAAAYLQLEEKSGSDSSILAQVPVTIQARIS